MCDQASEKSFVQFSLLTARTDLSYVRPLTLNVFSGNVSWPSPISSTPDVLQGGQVGISPPTVKPGPISLFSVLGIERRKSGISPVPFMPFGQLGLQRALLPLLTPEYHVK